VPLGRAATRAIRRYVLARRDNLPYLFVRRSAAPLTPNGMLPAFMRRGRVAGVHANPHLFRHTFAVTYLRNGGDVLSLQRILGHTSLDMVRHYAKLPDDDIIERHSLHSPADRV
jgi:site-specific recombinase XerD